MNSAIMAVATRRELLCSGAALSALSILPVGVAKAAAGAEVGRIVARIHPPRIPRRDFAVSAYGGNGDGKTDNSAAIARAIEACATAGGGRIVIPQGICLTGPIRLRSKMALHVPAGSRLRFIPDPQLYLPPVLTRWEGVELMGYHPLIYAFEESDIAVTGAGVIDGGADDTHWWPWKGPWSNRYRDVPVAEQQLADRTRLFDMAERGVPPEQRLFGQGNRLRPPLFQPYRCSNVMVEAVTLTNSPFWLLNPVECSNVLFRNVNCSSHGPNNDGIDPESCRDVLIERCRFDTGDDCIAIKSGRNADGRRIGKPCENIVIRNCHMQMGHAGVALGSELSGGIRNVFIEDCTMDSPVLIWALFVKTNGYRGGTVENIHVSRVQIGTVERALLQLWMHYEEGAGGDFVPVIRNITMDNVTVGRTERLMVIRGRTDSPITGVSLSNIRVAEAAKPSVVIDAPGIALDAVTVGGRPWTAEDLKALPGLESVKCDKWAVCR
ncbi:polygalacturonase [Sphingomonas zeicaulis]|uniref:glycoside hydrolase family 28 protein n=1 Tax=Sphingomonas zeicaulis TaxID=1632740 RepID=UPI003D231EC8